ncbi:hypothetical protein [Lentzea guizhouensis]|uniref:hypothetical protein n=1 Tax=Lentzea guizhouensis TaxID=1586287 RepID=UPI001F1D06FF|nr:hypothetical protein [Lentzea guizhouensis]
MPPRFPAAGDFFRERDAVGSACLLHVLVLDDWKDTDMQVVIVLHPGFTSLDVLGP